MHRPKSFEELYNQRFGRKELIPKKDDNPSKAWTCDVDIGGFKAETLYFRNISVQQTLSNLTAKHGDFKSDFESQVSFRHGILETTSTWKGATRLGKDDAFRLDIQHNDVRNVLSPSPSSSSSSSFERKWYTPSIGHLRCLMNWRIFENWMLSGHSQSGDKDSMLSLSFDPSYSRYTAGVQVHRKLEKLASPTSNLNPQDVTSITLLIDRASTPLSSIESSIQFQFKNRAFQQGVSIPHPEDDDTIQRLPVDCNHLSVMFSHASPVQRPAFLYRITTSVMSIVGTLLKQVIPTPAAPSTFSPPPSSSSSSSASASFMSSLKQKISKRLKQSKWGVMCGYEAVLLSDPVGQLVHIYPSNIKRRNSQSSSGSEDDDSDSEEEQAEPEDENINWKAKNPLECVGFKFGLEIPLQDDDNTTKMRLGIDSFGFFSAAIQFNWLQTRYWPWLPFDKFKIGFDRSGQWCLGISNAKWATNPSRF